MKILNKSSLTVVTNNDKKYYNSARDNLLHNFLEKYYKFTVVGNINCLIKDIQNRCPFKTEFEHETCKLKIWLDDENVFDYVFDFERRISDSSNIIFHYLRNIIQRTQ